MYKTIDKCRICGSAELSSVMDLGAQVLTGVFPKTTDQPVDAGPVELVRCGAPGSCGLVQLRQSYDLDQMYGMNYGYRSGLNGSMVCHLESKISKIIEMDILKVDDLILDIGSNDCTSLKFYPQGQYTLVGIDPSGEKFKAYYPDNIQLITDFFSLTAVQAKLGNRKAKVITSFSMFYDLESPVDFAKEVSATLADDGIWVCEQSYLPTMLEANSFDTICHEHLEFYALRQIEWIAKASGLKIIDVEFNDINGGSFSIIFAKLASSILPNAAHIAEVLATETRLELDKGQIYADFRARVETSKTETLAFLQSVKEQGLSVSGLGASTKGNVLLQHYGIGPDLISEIGEVNEDKFGAFTPGTKIPLLPERELLAKNPDYLFVLPWHFKSFFMGLPSLKGRKLVFPLPKFEIVEVR